MLEHFNMHDNRVQHLKASSFILSVLIMSIPEINGPKAEAHDNFHMLF